MIVLFSIVEFGFVQLLHEVEVKDACGGTGRVESYSHLYSFSKIVRIHTHIHWIFKIYSYSHPLGILNFIWLYIKCKL